jgi:hypothetical protein
MSDQQPNAEWICEVCGELMGPDEKYENICDGCADEDEEDEKAA